MELILVNEQKQEFHLRNDLISYVLSVEEKGILSQQYFGKRINQYHGGRNYPRLDRSFSPNLPDSNDRLFSLDTVLQEYPGFGNGDFRTPAQVITHENGSTVTDFRYHSFELFKGKKTLQGLPGVYATNLEEAETLIITLKDQLSELFIDLHYTIFRDRPVIIRSVKIRNESSKAVRIEKIASMSLDFPAKEFEALNLNGTWARERMVNREVINNGTRVFDSKRGASSHQQNPFLALMTPTTTEKSGEVYGFSLVYSGNHQILIEKDPYDQTRIQLGINPFNFSWNLTAQEHFQAPEVVMVYSDKGLNGMSNAYHKLFRERLTRGVHQYKERPILVNNWEATYFDFNEEKILNIAEEGRKLGIELFVLDDGWFGERDNDSSSLGDWFEHANKLKNGLKEVADQVHEKGIKFGLWFEPEMISKESKLFKEHSDWALQIPRRGISKGRDQYVLDFSREDVRENISQQLFDILDNIPIDYIKWDMNRHMTEVYSTLLEPNQQGEVAHRYILGLYDFLEKLITKYPAILFESCSGGGGRFDPGFLFYMPQTWTSDNTDAVARLKIQYGTSIVYPISTMGSHVSAVPNHQTQRITDLDMRGNTAMSGVFGYELDLEKLTENEKEKMINQIAFYKTHRQLIQYGDFYRLLSPFEGNETAWMFVSDDKSEALVFFFRVLSEASPSLKILQLDGLSKEKIYQCNESEIFGGDELMNVGFYIDPSLQGDFQSTVYHLLEV